MQRINIPFLASKYDKPSIMDATVQNLTNIYLEEVPDVAGNTEMVALGRPGTRLFATIDAANPVRGVFQHKDVGYVVVTDTVYKVTTGGVVTSLGTLAGSTGRVTISATNDEILFADGNGDARRFIPSTSTFATMSDADIPDNVAHIACANEYTLYLKPNSGTIYISSASDASTVSATNFIVAESNYDNVSTLAYNKAIVYLLGDVTTELWFNDGGQSGAPFGPVLGVVFPFGIAAKYSKCVVLDQLIFLAKNAQGIIGLVSANGTQYNIIQNRDLVEKINTFDAFEDAYAWTYAKNGHHFYCLTFPTADGVRGRTYSYDLTTGAWNELSCHNLTSDIGPIDDRFLAVDSMLLGGKQILGHWNAGKLYELTDEVAYDFYGEDEQSEIRAEWIGPHLTNKGNFFSISNLELDMEGGVAIDGNGQGSDPMVGLQVSFDRGHTWGTTKWRRIGGVGDYKRRIRWGSIGGGYQITLKLRLTDPVSRAFIQLTGELS